MKLKELQESFWQTIAHPAVARSATSDRNVPPFDSWIRANGVTPEKRISIYVNAYFARFHEVAAELYPRLHSFLGSENFHNLWLVYLTNFPPRGHNLRSIGEYLPKFLEETFPNNRLIYDITIFENHIIELFDKPVEPTASLAEIATLAPADLLELIPESTETFRLMNTPFDLLALTPEQDWQEFTPETFPQNYSDKQSILLYRPEFEVQFTYLSRLEKFALEQLVANKSFLEVCESISEQYSMTPEECFIEAAQAVAKFTQFGMIRRFQSTTD